MPARELPGIKTQADLDKAVKKLKKGDQDAGVEIGKAYLDGLPLDFSQVKLKQTFKLEKFEGDYAPGKEPFEVIEGGDDMPTTVRRKT